MVALKVDWKAWLQPHICFFQEVISEDEPFVFRD